MPDDDSRPSPEDRALFQSIAQDVRKRPDFYRDAGQWLDANYSNAEFAKRAEAERSELLRKARAGRTPEAKALIAELTKLRADKTGEPEHAEALDLATEQARINVGLSEKRLAELEDLERTGHLAPDANLRRLTPEEKTFFQGMSEGGKADWRKRAALTPAQKEERDAGREALRRFRKERDRLCAIVDKYFNGDLECSDSAVLAGVKGRRICISRSMLFRLGEAVRHFAKCPPLFPTLDESRRVLLLAWLLTDPEADTAGLKLTEFESWPWDRGPNYAGQDIEARRFAAEWDWYTQSRRDSWLALVRTAWGKAGPPQDNEHSEAVGHDDEKGDVGALRRGAGGVKPVRAPGIFPWGRLILWAVIFELALILVAWRWGSGDNILQRVANFWEFQVVVLVVSPFIVGRNSWRQLVKWWDWRSGK